MKKTFTVLSLVIFILAGCANAPSQIQNSTQETTKTQSGTTQATVEIPLFITPSREPMPGCNWKEYNASHLGLRFLGESCKDQKTQLEETDSAIIQKFNDTDYLPVIEVFKKSADETPEFALKNYIFKSLTAEEQKNCEIQKSEQLGTKNTIYVIDATEAYRNQLGKEASGSVLEGCGMYGFSNGVQYFMFQDSNPGMYIFVRVGQDIPSFDEQSIQFIPTENSAPQTPPISSGKKVACNTDADCVPDPTQCHPHACVTQKEAEGKQKPEMCTMMFDTQAAYSAEDCTCNLGICKNKNIPESITEPDTIGL